jgi:dihydrofolate synthase/folylpolyglutamate synthase
MYPGEIGFLRMRRLYARFKEIYNPKFNIIHVAGTSGKGSTTVMAAKILESLGLRVGIFVTPYLYNPNESIQVNGKPIKPRADMRARRLVEKLVHDVQVSEMGAYTFFEKLTARALVYFVGEAVDVIVVETAMGGLYDATNVVESDVSVIGPISVDHARLLGKDRASVAVHKAGIIKVGNKKVVVGRQFDDAVRVIAQTAKKAHVVASYLGKDFEVNNVEISEKGTIFTYRGYAGEGNMRLEDVRVALIGAHQADNAAVAITAARALLGPAYSIEKFSKGVKKALKKVKNPGRFSVMRHKNKTIILDVAHNPEKIASVVETFKKLYPNKRASVIFSCKWTTKTSSWQTLSWSGGSPRTLATSARIWAPSKICR